MKTLDNPVMLCINKVEDRTTKLGDEILIVEFTTQSESPNFDLAHIFYKPDSRQSESENRARISKLMSFCQSFGISTSVASDTDSWAGKTGRANLDYFTGLRGEMVPNVYEFVPRHLDYNTKLTDESNWRGDKTNKENL